MMKKTNLLLVMGLLAGLNFNSVKGAAAADDSSLFEDAVTIGRQEDTLQLYLDTIRRVKLNFPNINNVVTKEITADTILLKMVLNYNPEEKDSFYQNYTNHLLNIDPFKKNTDTSRFYLPYFSFLLKERETIENVQYNLIRITLRESQQFLLEASMFIRKHQSLTTLANSEENEAQRKKLHQRISGIIKQFQNGENNRVFGVRLNNLLTFNPEMCIELLSEALANFRRFMLEAGPITFKLYRAFSINKEEFLKTVEDLKTAALEHKPQINEAFLNADLIVQQTVLLQGIQPAQPESLLSKIGTAWEALPPLREYAAEAAQTVRDIAGATYESLPEIEGTTEAVTAAARNVAKKLYNAATGNNVEG
jgi:hypothetical protein